MACQMTMVSIETCAMRSYLGIQIEGNASDGEEQNIPRVTW